MSEAVMEPQTTKGIPSPQELGFDPAYGARPLRRYISHDIETRLGRALLSGAVPEGSTVRIDARDGDLVVEPVRAPADADVGATR